MSTSKWDIRYLDGSLEAWFDERSKMEWRQVAKEIKLLELCGNNLQLPHSRSLGQGLFELRERTFGLRIYYTFSSNQTITLLQAGDKDSQGKDIKIARKKLSLLRTSRKEVESV